MDEIIKDNGTTRESVKESWKEIWGPRIRSQALLERRSNAKLNSVIDSFSASGKEYIYSTSTVAIITLLEPNVISLLFLPYMLKDPKSSPDHKKIIQVVSVSTKHFFVMCIYHYYSYQLIFKV